MLFGPPYLCLKFSGGAKLKKELHDVIVTLLGGEEESGRACLERVTKIAASCSYENCFSVHMRHAKNEIGSHWLLLCMSLKIDQRN